MTCVFVVDDEREMVDLIALGLKKRGFQIVPFGNGADALAAICRARRRRRSSPIST